ncbi:MAG: hypothetical protein EXS30_07055 [Pedosphaera sp.]|nr:hypothetical protein [Pedosphaera sp.]
MRAQKLTILAIISTLVCTFALIAQQQSSSQPQQSTSTGTDSPILSKLSEIVSLREQVFKDYEVASQAGRASGDHPAEMDLAEARLELARERGQREVVLKELQNIVAIQERRLKRLQGIAVDRVPRSDVTRARAALLEAQVRLLRAQR